MTDSANYRAFVADVASGGDPKLLVYDLDRFEQLSGDERDRAVALLVQRLDEADARAAQTLGAAGLVEAVPALEAHTAHANASFRASVNRALARLTGSDEALARVAADIAAGDPVQAAFSAFSLAEIDAPEAVRGLLEGLGAPFLPTRVNSFRGLVKRFGVAAYTEPIQAPLWAWYLLLGTEFPSAIERGAEALRTLFQALSQGRSADELGLAYAPCDEDLVARVWTSLQDESADIDTEAARRLTGQNRLWAENQIVNRLTWKDPRAADAIAELRLDWALPALREARTRFEWAPDELLLAIDAAIADLTP
jgi:hypothetical protein